MFFVAYHARDTPLVIVSIRIRGTIPAGASSSSHTTYKVIKDFEACAPAMMLAHSSMFRRRAIVGLAVMFGLNYCHVGESGTYLSVRNNRVLATR